MRSARWTLATGAGFALTGMALHSPGASGVGGQFLEWDVPAAAFGAVLGIIAGAFTGALQTIALGSRRLRVPIAAALTVAIAHALADGAPSIWGVPVVAAISAVAAGLAYAWANGSRDRRVLTAAAVAWCGGWLAGVAIARILGLSNGSDQATWAGEHAVIGVVLGSAFGFATSPAMRRILGAERALSSVG